MARKVRLKHGLFRPARHKHLAEIVTFESVSGAREAARELEEEAKRAKRIDAVRVRAQALQYAANRAKAAARRRDLRPQQRKKLAEIASVYRRAASRVWKIYHEKKEKRSGR